MTSIDQYTVEEWLDTDVIQEVERAPYESASFRFTVRCSGRVVRVVRENDEAPLLIVAEGALDECDATDLRELAPPERRALTARLRGVLADVPGIYRFQDLSGTDVPFERFEAVRLERRLYPDAASRQALVDAVVDLTKGLLYVEAVVASALDELGDGDVG